MVASVLLLLSCNADEETGLDPVTTIQVTPVTLDLMVNEVAWLSAVTKNEAGLLLTRRTVTWTSRNPLVATVASPGIVTAIGIGQTTIVATSEGVSTEVPVSVRAGAGEIDILVDKVGLAADPQAFQVLLDGQPLGNPLTTFGRRLVELPVGMHTVTLTGLDSRCDLISNSSQVAFVVPRQRVFLLFSIACLLPSQLTVKAQTIGQRVVNAPYSVAVEGGAAVDIASDGEVRFDLKPRTYEVAFRTQDAHCLPGSAKQLANVREGIATTIQFVAKCYPEVPSLKGEKLVVSTRIPGGSLLEAIAPDGDQRFTVAVGPGGAGDAALSADGRRLAFRRFGATGGSNLVILDVATGTETVSASSLQIFGLSWSPDGQKLVTGLSANNASSLVVLRADGTVERNLGMTEVGALFAHWSPDGNTIAFTHGNHDINLISPDGSNLRTLRSAPDLYFDGGEWSPDGRLLLVRAYRQYCYYYSWYCYPYDARLVVIDVASGKDIRSVMIPTDAFGFVWGRTTSEVYYIHQSDVFYGVIDNWAPTNVTRSPEDEWLVMFGRFEGGAASSAARRRRG